MRMYCTVEGYEDSYVDFDERWTRGDIRSFGKAGGLIPLLQDKITGLRVRLVDGVLDSPSDITEEALDKMQWEVFQWFMTLPQLVVHGVLDLGEATRRQLLLTLEASEGTEESEKQQLTPTS